MPIPPDFKRLRAQMVDRQIAARGVRSPQVLAAMGKVRREGYVPSYLGEFAYEDAPLPIEEEQTISQPYIVAAMVEALELQGDERVLEIGTGSGYAAAVLAEIAAEVYTIERHERLAESARERLAHDGYRNIQVRHGDGTRGWPQAAPFDAIVVAAGGPSVPPSLREQLAVGGRLVIPVGEQVGRQSLIRVVRTGENEYLEEKLGDVRFVPLVGAEGWHEDQPSQPQPTADGQKPGIVVDTTGAGIARPPQQPRAKPEPQRPTRTAEAVAAAAEAFSGIDSADLTPLLARIGNARVVLIGEASHGTSEFYSMRARITRELIEKKGFNIVSAEADWPDASRVDQNVRDLDAIPTQWRAFARFPTWMWRNREVATFVDWLREYNARRPHDERVRFAGLDLYGMYNSIAAVLQYLDTHDPKSAQIARQRYGCLTPWQSDPAAYGRAALTGEYRSCEPEVVRMLEQLLSRRLGPGKGVDELLFDAVQNAHLISEAERYYRIMYYGAHESWNLRDRHMFATLQRLLEFHGSASKAVVWAHNSHVGNARATEMSARGELNIGQLCREWLRDGVYAIGFGTHTGTVAAASYWDGDMEIKTVLPSREDSYERLCHDSGIESFLLPLRSPAGDAVRRELIEPRLERAIGVIYRPETELASHYFHASLPHQFDEYVWFDRTEAVHALEAQEIEGVPETFPFGI